MFQKIKQVPCNKNSNVTYIDIILFLKLATVLTNITVVKVQLVETFANPAKICSVASF